MVISTIKYAIKRFLIRRFNNKVMLGRDVKVDFRSKIRARKGVIQIGFNVSLRSTAKGYQASMSFPTTLLIDVSGAKLSIGDNSRINGAYIHSQKEIKIGMNCVVASGVNIIDSNGHEVHSYNRTIGRDIPESIIIGNNVWIGLNAIILKGTVIGDNSVVSAGSVVKGIFPPNSLIVGNPGKLVKTLKITS